MWRADVEPKVKLHGWLALHEGPLTADRPAIMKVPQRGVCRLCNMQPETNNHLSRGCFFLRGVWGLVAGWNNIPLQHGLQQLLLEDWRNLVVVALDAEAKRKFGGVLLTVTWDVWKERCKSV